MAEQSEFSRLPKKILLSISENLIDNGFELNPYESYDYEECIETLENISKYFNINEIIDEDVQFFSKFLEINDELLKKIIVTGDRKLSENFIIPVAKRYKVEYQQYGTCTYTEYLETTWDSYDPDWVTDSMKMARETGDWDLYDGKSIDAEYNNHDMNDFQFDDVTEINHEKINESTYSKLVFENTAELIDNLDKNTLIKLKKLINQKLNS